MKAPSKLLAEWFWTDRWIGSSAFLLPLEPRGLYREMLTQAWRRGARLPADHEAIRRAVGCTPWEWRRCWPKVQPYWRLDGDALVNDTQLEVWEQTMAAHQRAVERGRKGGLGKGKPHSEEDTPTIEQAENKQSTSSTQVLLENKPPDPSPVLHTHRAGASARTDSLIARNAHRSHAMCGVVCVPSTAWDGMLVKLGGDEVRLTAWIRGVLAEWQGKVDRGEAVPDGDDFAFWRHRWAETYGTTKPAERKDEAVRSVPDAAETRAMMAKFKAHAS